MIMILELPQSLYSIVLLFAIYHINECSSFHMQRPRPQSRKLINNNCKDRASNLSSNYPSHTLFMGDHSAATLFEIGDTVTVVEDVIKAGRNLNGLSGTVIQTVSHGMFMVHLPYHTYNSDCDNPFILSASILYFINYTHTRVSGKSVMLILRVVVLNG